MSRATAFGNLMVFYAGRIAESLFCGDISSGASNDLERATDLARRMVCEWGMSERIGPLAYRVSSHSADGGGAGFLPLGEESRREIDAEIKRIVREAHQKAEGLLTESADDVRAVAEALLVRETLNREEVEELLSQRVATV